MDYYNATHHDIERAKIIIKMHCYLVFFVGLLFIVSSCALADPVTNNHFVPPGSGTGLPTGLSTVQKTVQATSTSNTTGATLVVKAYGTSSVTTSNAPSMDTSKGKATAGKLQQSGSKLLLNEAEREFSGMTSSKYTHITYVNEKSGTYNYDCSGFVGYALSRAVPGAFNVLQNKRPVAEDFYNYIVQCGPTPGGGGWMKVSTPLELLPGDIVVWLKPDASNSTSTGHIMIVTGLPVKNPNRTGEVLVQVIDSVESGHAKDTRGTGKTGLGKGTIGIMTDSSGLPTGYYWRGGESTLLQKTKIVFARIA